MPTQSLTYRAGFANNCQRLTALQTKREIADRSYFRWSCIKAILDFHREHITGIKFITAWQRVPFFTVDTVVGVSPA